MYQTLRQHPELFQVLTGLTRTAFDALQAEIEPLWQQADRVNRNNGPRLRRVGGGRKYGISFRERLLIACLCERRLLPTAEIATLYGIHPSTVNRYQQGLRALILKTGEVYRIEQTAHRERTDVRGMYPLLAELAPIGE